MMLKSLFTQVFFFAPFTFQQLIPVFFKYMDTSLNGSFETFLAMGTRFTLLTCLQMTFEIVFPIYFFPTKMTFQFHLV